MKHHDPLHPIGKCKGCPLNMRTYCAAGLMPKRQWDRGRCRHYGNDGLLDQILSRPEPTGAKQARLQRRAKAIATACWPHYNGLLDPAGMSERVRRRGRGD